MIYLSMKQLQMLLRRVRNQDDLIRVNRLVKRTSNRIKVIEYIIDEFCKSTAGIEHEHLGDYFDKTYREWLRLTNKG